MTTAVDFMNAVKNTLVGTRAGGLVKAGHGGEGGTRCARRQGQPLASLGWWWAGWDMIQGPYYSLKLKNSVIIYEMSAPSFRTTHLPVFYQAWGHGGQLG